jgi:polyisoprenoid-binding protein YceI
MQRLRFTLVGNLYDMKIRAIFVGLSVSILSVGCLGKKQTETTTPVEAAAAISGDTFQLDTLNSVIEWIGSTPGNYQHNGILKFSKGNLGVTEESITGGEVEVNMNSISTLDLTGKDKKNLEGHLMNEDFFEVEKFPNGVFQFLRTSNVTDSSGYSLQTEGNLTLKGITWPVKFRAKVDVQENILTAESASFKIDRTKWGIVYQSGIIGTIKDDLINDEVVLRVKLSAKKNSL